MPVPLDDLEPGFKSLVERTIEECAKRGIEMVPYETVRDPFKQGKLWRQSRTTLQIQNKLADLKSRKAHFLAHCIESVGPQHGRDVTGAIPGYSWHQWAEGVDCYWSINGQAEWDPERLGNRNGYRIYAHEGTKLGLNAGGYWQSRSDWPHLQKRNASNPSKAGYSISKINAEMESRFS